MEKVILREKNFSKLKEEVKKNKGKKIIFTSPDDEFNRKVIEKLPVKVLLISLSNRKDFSKQRNSGLNEVMAKIAAKNKVAIGFDIDEVVVSNEKEKIISRLRQNTELCKRNKVKMVFVESKEKRNPVLLKSLGIVLGMPNWMTKEL